MIALVLLVLAPSSTTFAHRFDALLALDANASAAPTVDAPPIELVETAPIETTLDHADIPNAADVWLEMIGGAKRSIDLAEFYVSDEAPSKLTPVVEALVAAAARGVKVRFVIEEKFYATYPELPDRFAKLANVELRRYKADKGILHAKYFVVDGRDAFFGSQNFDWRSLEHIQELGVRVREPRLAAEYERAFLLTWRAAGGTVAESELQPRGAFPVALELGGANVQADALSSPPEASGTGEGWELPRLVKLLDDARSSVRVQLLTYKMTTRDKSYWPELENALRRAAARGVKVQLLLADWCKRKGTIEALQALEPLENVEVKLVTIPQWSGGFVPFARVVHAKYLVVDGAKAWVGTSNWERDYFYESRNVGLIVEGGPFAARLERFFADGWGSSYAVAVDPCAKYEAPRIDK
ncbi:MAG: phospholipase D-like domain-containing protein [Planctomycetota bacterium]